VLENTSGLLPFQQKLWKKKETIKDWKLKQPNEVGLYDVIKNLHPTVLLGVSGKAGLFDETIVREMAANTPHPIIMPLSNPVTHSEATPLDLMNWTDNRAIIGTGSPFGTIVKNGKLFRID